MPQALPVGPLVVYLGDEPPGTSDDSATIRARRGYWWVDRSKPALWVCVDPAEGAAVWYRLGNAEDLAAIALSGDWADLAGKPIGTQALQLPRNTELASGAFAPHEPNSLWPIVPEAAHTLTPDDSGKIVWSGARDITLPDSAAPGMQPGWRVWVKNTDGASSLTIDCGGADTIDGGASLSLAAGESVLIVMIATGQFGSL